MTFALLAGIFTGAVLFAFWPRREVPVLVPVRCPEKIQAAHPSDAVRVIR